MAGQQQMQPGQELPKRLPLIIEPENRDDTTSKDAKLVNCYVEKVKTALGVEHWIYERAGLLSQSQPSGGAATGYGVFNWLGDVYSAFGNKLYKNGVAITGTIDTTNGVYRFDQVLGTTPQLVLGNGVKAYTYDSGAGLAVISDGDFPAAFVKGWSYLDGTLYVMKSTAVIQGSDLNTPSSWDPLNFLTAQIEPDMGVALAKQLVYVIAFKQWSTEVFFDAGNATGSPLGTVQGAKISFGCASADSVREIDGAILWLSTNRSGSVQVMKMDALKAETVSTPYIERLLDQADLTTVYSWTYKQDSHKFYVVTIKNENLTLAYDLKENQWCQWTDVNGNYMPIVDSTYTSGLQHILQHESDGRLYYMADDYATDNGSIITVDIVTPNFDGGLKRGKFLNRLEMVADQVTGSVLQVRVNDSDYNPAKWTNWRRLDMSKKRPFITSCGTFNQRAHHFRHQLPIRMPRIKAVELDLHLCTI